MYQKNLIVSIDGNVSVRLSGERLLTTPSGVCKGLIEAQDLVVTDMAGQVVAAEGAPDNHYRPSSELRMHLEIYRQRPDVLAIVHAHPPITTALTVAGVSLAACILPETLVNLGTIVTTAYATPTSADVPLVIHDLIHDHDALVLDRHGAVTVGVSPMDAYAKMEKVENTAQVIWIARTLGRVKTLPLGEIEKLSAKRDRLIGPDRTFAGPSCAHCGQCPGLQDGQASAAPPCEADSGRAGSR